MSEAPDQPRNELVIYATDDGTAQFYLRAEGGTVWLTQLELLAELFQTTKQNITLHIKNILSDGELQAGSAVKENLTTAADGSGRITHERMIQIAHERYEEFDGHRRKVEALKADADDIKELEQVAKREKTRIEP